jgi:hypothetical protein
LLLIQVPFIAVLLLNVVELLKFNEPITKTLFEVIVPDMFNVDNIVALFDFKLYEVMSYIQELLFKLLFKLIIFIT